MTLLLITVLLNRPWAIGPLVYRREPSRLHTLTLRVRYPDGRSVAGLPVDLLKMPDHTAVGWQNANNTCYTDTFGECTWRLRGGLYEFSFPEKYRPDPVTLSESGEGGLNGLGVLLDRDYTVGIVLADPHTRAAGNTLFFDQTPDEPIPHFRVPRQQGSQAIPPIPPVIVSELIRPTATPPVTLPADGPNSGSVERNTRSRLLLLVVVAAVAVGLAFTVYQSYRGRQTSETERPDITGRHKED